MLTFALAKRCGCNIEFYVCSVEKLTDVFSSSADGERSGKGNDSSEPTAEDDAYETTDSSTPCCCDRLICLDTGLNPNNIAVLSEREFTESIADVT